MNSETDFFVDSELETLYKYHFTYYYTGDSSDPIQDTYSGYTYAAEGTYQVDEYFDFDSSNNEFGLNGQYYISSLSEAENPAENGQVFIESYYDLETDQNYIPYDAGRGLASGQGGLGSEEDFINSEVDEDVIALTISGFFGSDFYVGDVVEEARVSDSGDYQIDALLGGYKWGTNTVTYSFYSDANGGAYYGNETGVAEVSEAVKDNVREIFEEVLEPVVDINFVEVTDTASDYGLIRIMLSNNPGYAYAYYPYGYDYNVGSGIDKAGDVHLNPNYDGSGGTNNFQEQPGKHGYMTLIHEIGHAIGLKHPGDYNGSGSGSGPFLPYDEDNTTNTLMTYNFAGNPASTPMPYDTQALHYIYDDHDHNTSGTTYEFNSVSKYFIDGDASHDSSNRVKQTIWDSSGTDTLDFSNTPTSTGSGFHIDLNEGGVITEQSAFDSRSYTARGDSSNTTYYTTPYGTAIAFNAIIEDVINSGSDDNIILNAADNTIEGYDLNSSTGDDVIEGSDAGDTLDLSAYTSSDVTQTQNGNDLVIDLGNNGTITIKDYYANNNQINILLNDPPSNGSVDNDFDGDGRADIHWRNGSDNQIWLMNGNTLSNSGNINSLSTSWTAVGNGDFDGNGIADLLFRDGSQLQLWEMNGTTVVNTYNISSLDSSWSIGGIGDTDGDGDDDIVFRNGNANRILEIQNFSDVGLVTLNNFNSAWSIVGMGDTDGDGDDDILFRQNNANRIWEIENNARVSVINIGAFNSTWSVVGLGDTDGDGDDDIIWRRNNANRLWEMDNHLVASKINIGGFNAVWQLEDVEDYDGDGDDDIIWRNGNRNKLWELDNNAVVSKTNVNSLDAAWELIG
ncbi:MAG: FG-GAP-like repeat-containing protein [Microcoleaceae cyanobacterium]